MVADIGHGLLRQAVIQQRLDQHPVIVHAGHRRRHPVAAVQIAAQRNMVRAGMTLQFVRALWTAL